MVWTSEESSPPSPTEGGFGRLIFDRFHKWGNRTALVDAPTGRGYTYAELGDVINRVAGNLYHNAGVRKGDVVLLYMPNSVQYAVLLLAIPSIGGIATGCNPLYTKYEVLRQLHDANAVYLVTTSEHQPLVPELLKERPQIRSVYIIGANVNRAYMPLDDIFTPGRPAPAVQIDNLHDVAMLPYSSGTTGLPKGVMITHLNIATVMLTLGPQGIKSFQEEKEVLVTVFPFFHISGAVVAFFCSLYSGSTLIILPKFDFKIYLEANQKYKATLLAVPPPVLVGLAKDPQVAKYDLSSVTQIMFGAAPASKHTLEEVQKKVSTVKYFIQGYGLTETCGANHYTRVYDVKLGSVGTVLPNVKCKIIDPATGEELPFGKDGEVCVHGNMIMKGYLNRPEATANCIKNGWLHSGDIGHVDDSGHLFIVDRLKELIKYKGFQVPPAELEALLLTHPDIAEAAVTGVPDEEAGELPRAFVVVKPGHKTTKENIQNFVKSRAAYYKQLRGGIEFVNEVPKSASGKLLRRILKDRVKAAPKSKI